jgi:hypothetical protein
MSKKTFSPLAEKLSRTFMMHSSYFGTPAWRRIFAKLLDDIQPLSYGCLGTPSEALSDHWLLHGYQDYHWYRQSGSDSSVLGSRELVSW